MLPIAWYVLGIRDLQRSPYGRSVSHIGERLAERHSLRVFLASELAAYPTEGLSGCHNGQKSDQRGIVTTINGLHGALALDHWTRVFPNSSPLYASRRT